MELEGWLALLAVVGSLAGVWLGGYLDRHARKEERDRLESFEFRKDASRVLGQAGLTLRAMDPLDYAALAGLDAIESRIDKRRREADDIRPELSQLAVRWSKAAEELSTIEKHLGRAPTELSVVVKATRALDDDDGEWERAFGSASDAFDKASAAFDRVQELLDAEP